MEMDRNEESLLVRRTDSVSENDVGVDVSLTSQSLPHQQQRDADDEDVCRTTEDRREIAFVNTKSGVLQGDTLIQEVVALFPANHVFLLFDAETNSPIDVASKLQSFREGSPLRIYVFGGDGTLNWITGVASQIAFRHPPVFALAPFGTGNELCRVLGWGHGLVGTVGDLIQRMRTQGQPRLLDLWNIDIQCEPLPGVVLRSVPSCMTMFFSIGWDANVAYKFGLRRDAGLCCPHCRCWSKTIYGCLGLGMLCEQCWCSCCSCTSCGSFFPSNGVSVSIDSNPVTLPTGTQSVDLINIPGMADGLKFWNPSGREIESNRWDPQAFDDQRFEMISTSGPGGYLCLRCCGCQVPHLGQGKSFAIRFDPPQETTWQIDGEGFRGILESAEVSFDKQIRILWNGEDAREPCCSWT